jgi:hypothetical protein
MTGYPALIETDQQIQGLLLAAAPGMFGVDVKDFHVTGHWLLDAGCWKISGVWYKDEGERRKAHGNEMRLYLLSLNLEP